MVGRDGVQLRNFELWVVLLSRLKNGLGKFIPCYRFVAAIMVNTPWSDGSLQQSNDGLGEVAGVGGAACLVMDDGEIVSFSCQSEHGFDKVVAVFAE